MGKKKKTIMDYVKKVINDAVNEACDDIENGKSITREGLTNLIYSELTKEFEVFILKKESVSKL